MDSVGDLFSRISVVVDERVDERIDELTNMTCKDCIHLQQNTCDHYHIEVDTNAYRICADMVSKDGTYYNDIENCPKLTDQLIRSGYITKVQGFKAL